MRKGLIAVVGTLLSVVLLISLTGCDFRKGKYSGKVFDVRVELWDGDEAKPKTWKNANELSYDKEENVYTFYVDGKLVEVDGEAVVLTEVGAPEPTSSQEDYIGKKFNLKILQEKDVIKMWENIEIKSAKSGFVRFSLDGVNMDIIPSLNHTIIIEEITNK